MTSCSYHDVVTSFPSNLGRYRLLGQLGSGDFCSTYLADDARPASDGVAVALKVATNKRRQFSGQLALRHHVQAAFATELDNLRRAAHALIIELAACQPEMPHALATKPGLCSALDLLRALKGSKIPVAQTQWILATMMAGAAHLHSLDIAWGDPGLKNMVLMPCGRLVLIDLCADGATISDRRDELLIGKCLHGMLLGQVEEQDSFYALDQLPDTSGLLPLGSPPLLLELCDQLARKQLTAADALKHAYWRSINMDISKLSQSPADLPSLLKLQMAAAATFTAKQRGMLDEERKKQECLAL